MVRLIKLPTIGIASLFLLVVTTTSFAARSLESATILTHHGDTAELDDYTCAAWQGECPDGQVAASRDKYCHCGRKHCHCTKHHCCKEKEGSEDKVGDEGDEDSVDYTCATWNGECAEGQVAASKDKYCHCGRKHCHCTEHHCCKEKEGSGDEVGDEGVEDSVDYTCAAWNGECAEGQVAASKDKYCHCGRKHCHCTEHHCCKEKEGSGDEVGDEGVEDSVDYTCAAWNGECAEGQIAASKDKYCHCGWKHCQCTKHHCCKDKELVL